MNLEPIILELDFIECAAIVAKGSIDLAKFSIPVDAAKLDRLLNINQKQALWVDYGEITPQSLNYPKQLDLLGHSNEPVVIIKSEQANDFYIFKLKQFIDTETMFYGRDQKYLIEKCLILWLTNFANSEKSSNEQFIKYFQVCKNQIVKINQLNNELSNQKLSAEKYLNALVHLLLHDINKTNHKISFSDSAILFLSGLDFNLESSKSLIIEAYKTAVELSPHSTGICIKRYFFNEIPIPNAKITAIPVIPAKVSSIFESKTLPKSQSIIKSKPFKTKMDKTILLLDRYEEAVVKLLEAKLPIMGKNIAQYCTPGISAPALTDSINKHASRIADCLIAHPNQWPNLRSKYQAIQKIQ